MFYFDKPENIDKLSQAIKGWQGTPWMLNARIKHRGADCSNYVAGVLVDSGARNRILIPAHSDWYFLHTKDDVLVDGTINLGVENGDFNNPKDGDIIMYKVGKSIAHTGIYLKGTVHHSLYGMGVTDMPWLNRKWQKRKRFVFRLKDRS
ncbi:MAG: hypothetical protein DRQ42_00170 [Gammaproteobacteria bacterium]|nr:MAG: hypothetical protein DRQ42_00170 [Gammaproteobacteria bacterium]